MLLLPHYSKNPLQKPEQVFAAGFIFSLQPLIADFFTNKNNLDTVFLALL